MVEGVKQILLVLGLIGVLIILVYVFLDYSTPDVVIQLDCIDSDGGVDYYERGSMNPSPCYEELCPSIGVWVDLCWDEDVLLEYSCGNSDGENYTCPYGCVRGVCLKPPVCKGSEDCFNGTVTNITDGDTLDVNNIPIRLALVNCPERYIAGYEKAKSFVSNMCPIGSIAMVDEDDLQTEGSYGRMVAVVYCDNKNLNEELLENGFGNIDVRFCDRSEFGNGSWARKFGC